MKEPCCAICKVGSINCAGNGWYPSKNSLSCYWTTSTASSTTAAPKYPSGWWKPSTATSKPFFEGVVATRISPICCSRPNAWQLPRPNSSFFRKQPKMRVSTNSCAEPDIHRERRSLRSLHRLAPCVVYRGANVPGSALVHIQRSSLGTAQEVDLPRCRLVATSRTPSRLRGERTPRSAESGTRICGSSDRENTRAQLGSALQRRDPACAPNLAAPVWLRYSL